MAVFKVNDMSCGHCEKAITSELKKENPEVKVAVDLKAKTVTVENLPEERVIFLLEEIGYSAEKLQ